MHCAIPYNRRNVGQTIDGAPLRPMGFGDTGDPQDAGAHQHPARRHLDSRP